MGLVSRLARSKPEIRRPNSSVDRIGRPECELVPQGRPTIAHRFNGGKDVLAEINKPRWGERRRRTRPVRMNARWAKGISAVPDGTCSFHTPPPSNKSVGYFLSPWR